jgi:hypothetical protein
MATMPSSCPISMPTLKAMTRQGSPSSGRPSALQAGRQAHSVDQSEDEHTGPEQPPLVTVAEPADETDEHQAQRDDDVDGGAACARCRAGRTPTRSCRPQRRRSRVLARPSGAVSAPPATPCAYAGCGTAASRRAAGTAIAARRRRTGDISCDLLSRVRMMPASVRRCVGRRPAPGSSHVYGTEHGSGAGGRCSIVTLRAMLAANWPFTTWCRSSRCCTCGL